MKKIAIIGLVLCFAVGSASAQIDLDKIINLDQILGKVLNVQRGFAPKFSLGNISIPRIAKVAEILGLKKNDQIDRLFSTFRTGRAIYKIAAYAGGAIAAYGAIKAIDKSAVQKDYKGALISGLSTIATGLLVKFLTKGASYKAADIFNGIIKKKVKGLFSITPAYPSTGPGVYVKL